MSSPRATPNITGPPVVIPLSFLPNAERTHIVSVWLKRCASLPITRLPDCVRSPIVLHSINNVRILIENYFKNVIDQNKRDRRVFIFFLFHCIYYLIYREDRCRQKNIATAVAIVIEMSSVFCCHARFRSISKHTKNSDSAVERDKSNRGNRPRHYGHPGSSLFCG